MELTEAEPRHGNVEHEERAECKAVPDEPSKETAEAAKRMVLSPLKLQILTLAFVSPIFGECGNELMLLW